MAVKRNCFPRAVMEGISQILGDTQKGLSGNEIQNLLAQVQIIDVEPTITKRKRLFSAFANYQNNSQCSNAILNFIKEALAPSRFVNNHINFEEKRALINQQLHFVGYQYNENGTFSEITQAKTISDAQLKADNLKSKLEMRGTHFEIFKY